MRNTFFVLMAISVTVLCAAHAVQAQQPANQQTQSASPTPLIVPTPPRVPGVLYSVPGQLFPINSATGMPQLPPEIQAKFDKIDQSATISNQAEAEGAKGSWVKAIPLYQQALALEPRNAAASYGLGDYALTKNDLQAAVGYYRQAIYNYDDPPSLRVFIGEANAYRVMEFALLLSQTGQQDEALTVYRHGAHMLNYMYGRPYLKLMLPDFGDGPGQVAFTPERLQAMAQVGWAIDHVDFDHAGAWTRLQNAAALYPDSPVPYLYRARHLMRCGGTIKAIKADFDKAAQLSAPAEADAVQEERHFFHHALGEDTPAVQKPSTAP